MNTTIRLTFVVIFALMFASSQVAQPDLTNPEHLEALGSGRLVENDKSQIRNIRLIKVNEYWIVFRKDGSLHDMMMERIARIEFPESKWGALVVTFKDNEPTVTCVGY